MRLLLTNDDGVFAPGLGALGAALADAGHEVVVAAPPDDRSGTSAAVGLLRLSDGIAVEAVELPGIDGAPCFAVEGPPALAVMAARLDAFGPCPELVVSGINHGPNTGRVVLHSGTVGAALSAANFGLSALAVSMVPGDPLHWSTAAHLAVDAVERLASEPARTVLNLNVPNRAVEGLRGVRWAELAPFGTVQAALVESQGGGLQVELSGAGDDDDLSPDSDTALLGAGYATVTSLTGITAAARSDVAEVLEGRLLRRTA